MAHVSHKISNRLAAGSQRPEACSTKNCRGTILGVPIIRIIVYWGLFLGSPYFGKLPQIGFVCIWTFQCSSFWVGVRYGLLVRILIRISKKVLHFRV